MWRSLAFTLVGCGALLWACTPEATVVEPVTNGDAGEASEAGRTSAGGGMETGGTESNGGSSGNGGSLGTAGKAGTAGSAGGQACRVASPRPGCVACLARECSSEFEACQTTDCACRTWGGYTGQMSCMLACLNEGTMMPDQCAPGCDLGDNFGASHATTKSLFDCLMNPPGGPPVCEECLPPMP